MPWGLAYVNSAPASEREREKVEETGEGGREVERVGGGGG